MAHHKRGRPKNRRAGCLLCKPHKANHAPLNDRAKPSDRRRIEGVKDDIDQASDRDSAQATDTPEEEE